MDEQSTVQILTTRAETAEKKLEDAIKAIERAHADIVIAGQLLAILANNFAFGDAHGAARLIRLYVIEISDYLDTWDIPF